jgi:peptide deformylase
MIRPILHHPHPTLLKVSQPVTEVTDEHIKLAIDMVETMHHFGGVGLAAPQVGELVRLIVVRKFTPNTFPTILFNPVITARSGSTNTKEGCLSVPRAYDWVKRSAFITVEGLTLTNEPFKEEFSGLEAVIYQHEIDHLDGIEFIDHLSPARRLLMLKESKKHRTKIS